MTLRSSPFPILSRVGAALRGERVTATLIFLGTVAVFARAVGNDFTLWDDPDYLVANPLVVDTSVSGFLSIATAFVGGNWHPLTIWSYWLEHALFGMEPAVYHATNVLVHGLSAVLAYRLGRYWLEDPRAAVLAAVLFAVHPLRVESVAWVSERKDVLCTFFYLLTLVLWERSAREVAPGRTRALALGAFVLALLSKVMAITLPAVLVLRHLCRSRDERTSLGCDRTTPALVATAPFWVLAISAAVVGYFAQAGEGAIRGLHGGEPVRHVLTVVAAVGFYAAKLIVPVRLSALYRFAPAQSLGEPLVLLGLAVIVLSTVTAVVSLRRRRVALLAVGFFWITWSPVSGLVPSTTPVADRYLYLPGLGVAFALAMLVSPFVVARARGVALATRVALVACGLAMALGSWARVGDWRDNGTLWRSALAVDPDHPIACNQLARWHLARGEYQAAAGWSRQAIDRGLAPRPGLLFNLCAAYRGMEDPDKELACARSLRAAWPEFAGAWEVEIRQALARGDVEAARGLAIDLEMRLSGTPDALHARAAVLAASGELDEALVAWGECLRVRPGFRPALLGLSDVLARLGEGRRAMSVLARLLALRGGALFPDERREVERILGELRRGADEITRVELDRLARSPALSPRS